MKFAVGRGRVCVLATALLVGPGATSDVAAPQDYEPPPEVDPYTRGDPEALQKAGYVALGGSLLWGDGHTTDQVLEVTGGFPILWVETEHFLVGSSLEAYPVGDDPDERDKLRDELKRLKKVLPRVKSSTGELDPWLRLHLQAQRLEELWERFVEVLSIDERDYLLPEGQGGKAGKGDDGAPSTGGGPYFGMKNKFRVLVLQKESGIQRFAATYIGLSGLDAYIHHYRALDAFFLGTSAEILKGSYGTDTGLHCAVVYWQVQNFLAAFRGFTHYPPVWFRAGIGRWFMRDVDPTYQLFASGDRPPPGEEDSDWEPKVRARVGHEAFPSTEEMLAWDDLNALRFTDHLFPWSRIDYLLREEPKVAHQLLLAFTEPISLDTRLRPSDEELVASQAATFSRVVGDSPAEFDVRWARWVERNYRRK